MSGAALSPLLLQILVCPVCREPVSAGPDRDRHAWLHCRACGRYYPIQDGIPVMLEQRATYELPQQASQT